MLKKYKILMFLIAFVLLGIVAIIFVWLYGTYKGKEEVLVSEVERSLFNSVQTYYRSHLGASEKWKNGSQPNPGRSEFFDRVMGEYPHIDRARLHVAWDSSFNKLRGRNFGRRFRSSAGEEEEPRGAVPFFMMQDMSFDEEDIVEINRILDTTLQVKNVHVTAQIDILSGEKRDRGNRKRYEIMDGGDIKTRAIWVDLDKNQYISAVIERPFLFILWKISFQVVTSVLLLLALIGAFFYLFLTINKQNKIAVLRRSFVNNMTHELKTPVATVMAAIEAVQRYGAKDNKSKMEKYLAISHRELEHLSGMIERVLQLDMDEVSGMVLDKSDFDLAQLIRECIETAKLHSQKAISVVFQTRAPAVMYFGDAAHIKNVLSNLLDNAIKYSDEDVQIAVELTEDDDNLKIQVTDQGQGIPSNYMNDIFDMFFRVPKGNLHAVKGFGLGLSYVRQIVEKHGGRIAVSSKVGEGSTFTIFLPKTS